MSIQGSINAVIGTVGAVAGAASKAKADAQIQKVENAKADAQLSLAEVESEKRVGAATEAYNQALEKAGSYKERGKGFADSKTGKFAKKSDVVKAMHDVEIAGKSLGALQKEQTAIRLQRELFNSRVSALRGGK